MNTDTSTIHIPTAKSLDALNSLLRGEFSAVDTFKQAIAAFGTDVPSELRISHESHRARCEKLTARILELGGKPAEGGGAWASFTRIVEGGAALFGRKTAIAALEEGEDHGLKVYRERLEDLDDESRRIVLHELLPAQQKSHDAIRGLSWTMA